MTDTGGPHRRPTRAADTGAARVGARATMGDMDAVLPYILALAPTVGVAGIFYVVMKNILEGDRRERLAQAKWEAQQRADKGDERG
ncbi:MAG TPA: hypothetical protein VFJ94_10275 [Intrasporangium sp.]|uniref:hypothetical protein n=1 Tax=Intrasporangium sp. TaxID=1925024 RepID=UPI002D771CC0|nr:hypothetical protein [Intrasporangium sp.]HET7398895.1 hypothetical protein [Intrasporangium sp.]